MRNEQLIKYIADQCSGFQFISLFLIAELIFFFQTITYYAEGSQKKEHRKVAELKRPEIKPGDDDIWANVEVTIPPLPPSHLEYCRIIDIEYEFKVWVFLYSLPNYYNVKYGYSDKVYTIKVFLW